LLFSLKQKHAKNLVRASTGLDGEKQDLLSLAQGSHIKNLEENDTFYLEDIVYQATILELPDKSQTGRSGLTLKVLTNQGKIKINQKSIHRP